MLAFFALRGGGYGPEKRKNKAIPCELESMWFVLRWVSREREARGRTSHLDASYARSSFPSHPMLHYGRVCACIPRRDISSLTSAGVSSWPSRPCAAPSLRVLPNASRRLPCSARSRSRMTEPIAPFLIIPIDTSSTWVCPWCCDVSGSDMTCPLSARPCAPLRGHLSTALFHVKHLCAL